MVFFFSLDNDEEGDSDNVSKNEFPFFQILSRLLSLA